MIKSSVKGVPEVLFLFSQILLNAVDPPLYSVLESLDAPPYFHVRDLVRGIGSTLEFHDLGGGGVQKPSQMGVLIL